LKFPLLYDRTHCQAISDQSYPNPDRVIVKQILQKSKFVVFFEHKNTTIFHTPWYNFFGSFYRTKFKGLLEEEVMKRRKTSLVLCILVTGLLVSCSKADVSTVGIAVKQFDNAYLTLMRKAIQTKADELGLTVDITDGRADQTIVNNNVDLYVTKGYRAIGVNLQDSSGAEGIIQKATAKNIAVVFFNVEPDAGVMESSKNVYYVGAKAEDSGVMQGEALVEYWKSNPGADLNNDGVLQYVMLMGEPGHQDAKLRTEYSVKTIEAAGIKVQEVAKDTANWQRSQGQDVMAAILAANSNIEAVIANNDEMALGAIEAMKAKGYFIDGGISIPVVGVDATTEALIAIKDGTLYSSPFNDAVNQGYAVVKLCELLSKGETPTAENLGYNLSGRYVWIPYVNVTIKNVDNF
jgi:methyl-galactoside transport system substrate-binding protein